MVSRNQATVATSNLVALNLEAWSQETSGLLLHTPHHVDAGANIREGRAFLPTGKVTGN